MSNSGWKGSKQDLPHLLFEQILPASWWMLCCQPLLLQLQQMPPAIKSQMVEKPNQRIVLIPNYSAKINKCFDIEKHNVHPKVCRKER